MKNKIRLSARHFILVFIFLVSLLGSLYFAFEVPNLSSDEAYFHLRIALEISNKGYASFFDELSYGGRTAYYPILFEYILAFFMLFLDPIFVLKVVPTLLISSTVFIVYLLARYLTQDKRAALFSAALSGFIPLVVRETLNKASVYSLVIPLVFWYIYFFLRIKESKKYLSLFILFSFLLPLLHPSAFLLIIAMLFYIIFITIESFKMSNIRKEGLLFSAFLILLIEFIIYKKAFLDLGFNVVYANLPQEIIKEYFTNINLINLFYLLGILSVVFGVYGIYYTIFVVRKSNIFFISGLILSIFLLLMLRLININDGLLFVGVAFCILSSIAVSYFLFYIERSKFFKFKKFIIGLVFVIFLLTSVVASVREAGAVNSVAFDAYTIEALEFILDNTAANATILATPQEGHLISALASRKNVVDTNYLLAPAAQTRLSDIEIIYQTWIRSRALALLNKYDVDYILLSDISRNRYLTKDIKYANDGVCFIKVFENERTKIYKVNC